MSDDGTAQLDEGRAEAAQRRVDSGNATANAGFQYLRSLAELHSATRGVKPPFSEFAHEALSTITHIQWALRDGDPKAAEHWQEITEYNWMVINAAKKYGVGAVLPIVEQALANWQYDRRSWRTLLEEAFKAEGWL